LSTETSTITPPPLAGRHTSTRHLVRERGGGVPSLFGYLLASTRPYLKIAALSQLGSPVLYLLSLGIGLGSIVNGRDGGQSLGTSYLSFLAPALIAATALQVAVGQSMYPILFGGFKFQRIYFAMNATPLTPQQIASGVLAWIATRSAFTATLYLAVVACFGGVRSVGTLLCIPIATLGAMALAAPIVAYSATVETERGGFAAISRFLVMPMFLFSGTFYPVSALPEWGRVLAWLSPLWHATELARWASLGSLRLSSGIGQVGTAALLGHLAFLTALTVAGVLVTGWRFRVRLSR
jgi:lipooligosaccharide transport system permease protein